MATLATLLFLVAALAKVIEYPTLSPTHTSLLMWMQNEGVFSGSLAINKEGVATMSNVHFHVVH